jgi:hypothetical protein
LLSAARSTVVPASAFVEQPHATNPANAVRIKNRLQLFELIFAPLLQHSAKITNPRLAADASHGR